MDIPKDLLNKEFLSQFKSEEDVSKFLTDLHARVLEQMLEGEMDSHLGYQKYSVEGNNSGNSCNGKPTTSQEGLTKKDIPSCKSTLCKKLLPDIC